MRKLVLPSELGGSVAVPASKSQTIRALAAGLLARGESLLLNPSCCDDAITCLQVIKQLGAEVDADSRSINPVWKIKGGFPEKNQIPPPGITLSCGE